MASAATTAILITYDLVRTGERQAVGLLGNSWSRGRIPIVLEDRHRGAVRRDPVLERSLEDCVIKRHGADAVRDRPRLAVDVSRRLGPALADCRAGVD